MADRGRPTWADLGTGARLFRIAHGVWGALNLAGLAYVYGCAALRRRDRWSDAAVALLTAEGAELIVGRGDCPFGPFQARLGDPVPMFEWVLPPRAAKAAIPVLASVSIVGVTSLVVRGRDRGSGVR